MATERDESYLRGVLKLDPQFDARRIVALRAAHLDGSPPPPPDEDGNLAARRLEQIAALARIRNGFWSAEERQLAEELDAIDAQRFPELLPEVVRLRRAAAVRGELESLAGERGRAVHFVRLLRDVCTASPREAAAMREASISALRSAQTPEDRRLRRDCRRIARQVSLHCPILSAFEGAWLADVVAARTGWRTTWRRAAGPLAFACLLAILLVWLLEVAGLRLLRGMR